MPKGKGGGRKPYKDRDNLKIQVPLYLKVSTIKEHGGIDAIRAKVKLFLNEPEG